MKEIKIKGKNYTYKINLKYHQKDKNITNIFYFLDGQNAFKDKLSMFNKSLRATKTLNKLKEPYLAVAIYSSPGEERFLEYYPFNEDNTRYINFINDFNNLIIPICEKKLKIKNRYLIASSLASLPALELSSNFKAIALFSSAFFLNYEGLKSIIKPNNKTFNFLAVGGQEKSDEIYNEEDYLEASYWYFNYCKEHNMPVKLYFNPLGKHDEISWRIYLKAFIKHIKKTI